MVAEYCNEEMVLIILGVTVVVTLIAILSLFFWIAILKDENSFYCDRYNSLIAENKALREADVGRKIMEKSNLYKGDSTGFEVDEDSLDFEKHWKI